jgi:hypothetical protein
MTWRTVCPACGEQMNVRAAQDCGRCVFCCEHRYPKDPATTANPGYQAAETAEAPADNAPSEVAP